MIKDINEAKNVLRESLKVVPTMMINDYLYFIHPLTDGVPYIDPKTLDIVSEGFLSLLPKNFDRIVTIEAMGIPLATVLSIKTSIPFTIIRKKSYSLKNEKKVLQVTGYSKGDLYINGLKKGMKIVIVDDVISTGGTLRAVIKTLEKMDVEILKVLLVFNKMEKLEEFKKEMGIEIIPLLNVFVKEGRLVY